MMVVPRPRTIDGEGLQSLVDAASEDDTEELLMNKLFRGRCSQLKDGTTCPSG